ncbi:hypothetical protein JXJ21_12330 [candidate division KSB1 bacterium]|nr:hypothetical protein [candidate division KSB1 bacterium]
MSSYLNLIGSFIIGGLLLLAINRFYSGMQRSSYEKLLDDITSQHTAEITELIEFDFNRMGLHVSHNTNALLVADSSRIFFLSDNNSNGAVDTVKYILSDVNAASSTENPRDRILYRLINNQTQQDVALGVTDFKIRYYDSMSYLSSNLSQIRTFDISLAVESTSAYDNHYSRCFWQTRITPPNLLRF